MLSWLKQHKNALILGVLGTVLGGVILYFIIPQSQANIIVTENTSKDWCQQTYGIKTPPKYIQNQSIRKCFYPLVYSWGYVNSGSLPSDWFSQRYFKSYKIDIANLSTEYNIDSTVSIASNSMKHDIYFSCKSSEIELMKRGVLIIEKLVNLNKTIYCGIVIVSSNDDISTPNIIVSSTDVESQYIKSSLWSKKTIGTNFDYSENSNNDIFKPFNEYFYKN
ncbi:hypothetical protein [Francisella hispaniensis]|uniref:Uncharacterized protein n=1 Tax=Francisella hispaniensis TaxID=622488 RepID=F4BHX6_9GAMM|nr:hypothetical protein [Francisella hispaniensis]AEE27070.1 conserved hypothetical protein [Francisella hispaniensis]